MADIHPKHTFVDEYPHLVYDGENDATLDDASFTLPTASADTLGGVKVGDGLSISDSGVLSASGGGGGGGGLVVHDVEGTLDKTWEEIKNAFPNVSIITSSDEDLYGATIVGTIYSDSEYNEFGIAAINSGRVDAYMADNKNGYPVYQND